MIRITKDPMELFSMEQCKKETLHLLYERFTKAVQEIEAFTSCEKIVAFQKELHEEECPKTLIIDPSISFAEFVA